MVETDRELIVEWRPDDIVVLTLNRPRARNTVSFTLWEQFSAVLDRLEGETPARAVVLCGAEGYFSNGGDVKVPPSRGDGALRLAKRLELGQRAIARLHALPMPTIAAVEGGAFGIAWSIALACDMIIVSESAKFGAPFLDFGLVPDGGGAWFLSRQIGARRAADIYYSGRTLDAAEAVSLGLASRLAAPGKAVEDAIALAETIGKGNRQAAELTKRLLTTSETSDLATSHALELAYCHICQTGEEVVRAREAFVARSKARAKS